MIELKGNIMKNRDHRKKISAIIPNYNYADYIDERINSILKQTYPVSQIVILDDASTDNSVKLIEERVKGIKDNYSDIDIIFIKNKKNSGGCVFYQWQKGIKEATGDYIWIAEADDSADTYFLETAMKKFEEYPKAVLFYSDSRRIDQDGNTISATSTDLEDIWGNGRWGDDYYNNGINEIVDYLSANNTIINVSGVVWKNNKNLMGFFEEAKNFKIAGDWYIYTRVLEYGDIVYSSKPLNYYRKHNRGSVSSVVNLMREYEEVVRVQERIAQKFKISSEQIKWQKIRREMMGMVENDENIDKKGRVAWLVPDFVEGYGGHRTIFQNMNELVRNGYACDLYIVELSFGQRSPRVIYDEIIKYYGNFRGDIYIGQKLLDVKKYDAVVATSWNTAKPVMKTNVDRKLYFIQDYEPWFFPMSEEFLLANSTYGYGLTGISIGRWLANKIMNEFGAKMASFDFCADLDIYKRNNKDKKENAICFIYQPFKPRRCANVGLKALQIVQKLRPDVDIYLYGSQKVKISNIRVKHLGVISTDECNKLYNKCKVGLCISATNPSRIPFEMMASGLPVVDIYGENTIYDFPEDGCLLAEPSPEAIATAILKLLDDDGLRLKMSRDGAKYMKQFPLRKGFEQFVHNFEIFYNLGKFDFKKPKKLYNNKCILASIDSQVDLPEIKIKTFEEIEIEKRRKDDEEKKLADEEWRKNLAIPQRIYLKIRYILRGY